jgi:hypothetical protein
MKTTILQLELLVTEAVVALAMLVAEDSNIGFDLNI